MRTAEWYDKASEADTTRVIERNEGSTGDAVELSSAEESVCGGSSMTVSKWAAALMIAVAFCK